MPGRQRLKPDTAAGYYGWTARGIDTAMTTRGLHLVDGDGGGTAWSWQGDGNTLDRRVPEFDAEWKAYEWAAAMLNIEGVAAS